MNLYQYVWSNPASAVDPWGLSPEPSGGGPPNNPPEDKPFPPWWVGGCAKEAGNWNDCTFCCYYHSNGKWTPDAQECAAECDREFPPTEPPPDRPYPGTSYLQCLYTRPAGNKQCDRSSCSKAYGRCDCLKGVNVRCMCKCMGTSKWECFMRGCLQCMRRVPGMDWRRAHSLCFWKAFGTWPMPADRFKRCVEYCGMIQSQNCKCECDPPDTGP